MASRLDRLRAAWPEGADALIVTGRSNRRYLTGCPSGRALWVAPQRAVLLSAFTEAEGVETAAAASGGAFAAQRVTGDLGPALAELARGCRRVLFEGHVVSAADAAAWSGALGGVALADGGRMVEPLRAVKEPGELDAMRRAAELMDQAFRALLPRLRPGLTEREVELDLEFDLRRRGAAGVAFPFIVASGPRGSLPHGGASERRLRAGDLVTFDVGARFGGYCSDMTRTVAVGEPGERGRQVYAAVSAALDAALAGVRAGAGCRALDSAAREVLAGAGFGEEAFGHGLGHGVGLDVHEAPALSRRAEEDEKLAAGMVVTVEPGVYLPGWGGVRIEEEVAVTADGYELLTHAPRDLLILD